MIGHNACISEAKNKCYVSCYWIGIFFGCIIYKNEHKNIQHVQNENAATVAASKILIGYKNATMSPLNIFRDCFYVYSVI